MSFNILLNNLANNTFYIFIILSYFARTHFHGFNLCKIHTYIRLNIVIGIWMKNEVWKQFTLWAVPALPRTRNKISLSTWGGQEIV